MNQLYLFLLAITLGFGFALGGVLARLLERVVRFELRIRESRRRLLLKLELDRELKKIEAATAAEPVMKPVLAERFAEMDRIAAETFRDVNDARKVRRETEKRKDPPVWFCGDSYVGRA